MTIFRTRWTKSNGLMTGSFVYEYILSNKEDLINCIRNNAKTLGYTYTNELQIDDKEKFEIFTKVDPNLQFPAEKIAIYQSDYYRAERIHDPDLFSGATLLFPNLCDPHDKIGKKRFYDMIVDDDLREYSYPEEMMGIEFYLLIIVDKWNEVLNRILNKSERLPFILLAVIVRTDPDVIYISKDIRRKKKKDYYEKINEFLDIMNIKKQEPFDELTYQEIEFYLNTRNSTDIESNDCGEGIPVELKNIDEYINELNNLDL